MHLETNSLYWQSQSVFYRAELRAVMCPRVPCLFNRDQNIHDHITIISYFRTHWYWYLHRQISCVCSVLCSSRTRHGPPMPIHAISIYHMECAIDILDSNGTWQLSSFVRMHTILYLVRGTRYSYVLGVNIFPLISFYATKCPYEYEYAQSVRIELAKLIVGTRITSQTNDRQ